MFVQLFLPLHVQGIVGKTSLSRQACPTGAYPSWPSAAAAPVVAAGLCVQVS